jgi:hypothetical protein
MNSVKCVVKTESNSCMKNVFKRSLLPHLRLSCILHTKSTLRQEVQNSLSLSERVFKSVLPFLTQKVGL